MHMCFFCLLGQNCFINVPLTGPTPNIYNNTSKFSFNDLFILDQFDSSVASVDSSCSRQGKCSAGKRRHKGEYFQNVILYNVST